MFRLRKGNISHSLPKEANSKAYKKTLFTNPGIVLFSASRSLSNTPIIFLTLRKFSDSYIWATNLLKHLGLLCFGSLIERNQLYLRSQNHS